jgi:hypothetical protein
VCYCSNTNTLLNLDQSFGTLSAHQCNVFNDSITISNVASDEDLENLGDLHTINGNLDFVFAADSSIPSLDEVFTNIIRVSGKIGFHECPSIYVRSVFQRLHHFVCSRVPL